MNFGSLYFKFCFLFNFQDPLAFYWLPSREVLVNSTSWVLDCQALFCLSEPLFCCSSCAPESLISISRTPCFCKCFFGLFLNFFHEGKWGFLYKCIFINKALYSNSMFWNTWIPDLQWKSSSIDFSITISRQTLWISTKNVTFLYFGIVKVTFLFNIVEIEFKGVYYSNNFLIFVGCKNENIKGF